MNRVWSVTNEAVMVITYRCTKFAWDSCRDLRCRLLAAQAYHHYWCRELTQVIYAQRHSQYLDLCKGKASLDTLPGYLLKKTAL